MMPPDIGASAASFRHWDQLRRAATFRLHEFSDGLYVWINLNVHWLCLSANGCWPHGGDLALGLRPTFIWPCGLGRHRQQARSDLSGFRKVFRLLRHVGLP